MKELSWDGIKPGDLLELEHRENKRRVAGIVEESGIGVPWVTFIDGRMIYAAACWAIIRKSGRPRKIPKGRRRNVTTSIVAWAFATDRAHQYDESSGIHDALLTLAERFRNGEHLEAYRAGKLDDLIERRAAFDKELAGIKS